MKDVRWSIHQVEPHLTSVHCVDSTVSYSPSTYWVSRRVLSAMWMAKYNDEPSRTFIFLGGNYITIYETHTHPTSNTRCTQQGIITYYQVLPSMRTLEFVGLKNYIYPFWPIIDQIYSIFSYRIFVSIFSYHIVVINLYYLHRVLSRSFFTHEETM